MLGRWDRPELAPAYLANGVIGLRAKRLVALCGRPRVTSRRPLMLKPR